MFREPYSSRHQSIRVKHRDSYSVDTCSLLSVLTFKIFVFFFVECLKCFYVIMKMESDFFP